MKEKNTPFFLLTVILILPLLVGCLGQPIQPFVIEPRSFVTGKVTVPPGKDPLGMKIQVAGKDASVKIFENPYFAYADENGNFSLELRNGGRYLLFAQGRDFNINYGWVDAILEGKVTAPPITVNEKVLGEATFMMSLVDFPTLANPQVVIKAPAIGSLTYDLFDDGTHGDKAPGDKIWTAVINGLTSGRIEYKLKNNGTEVNDPYQESSLNGNSVLFVKPSQVRQLKGEIVLLNPISGDRIFNLAGITVSTERGVRKTTLTGDGKFELPVPSTGDLVLLFSGTGIERIARTITLGTTENSGVENFILTEKTPGEAKFLILEKDYPGITSPKVLGDFSNFTPLPLHDDGTNGDEVAGDGIFTLLVRNLSPGNHSYKIMPFDDALRDPYEEGSLSDNSLILVN